MLSIRPASRSDAEAAFDIRRQAIRHQCSIVYTAEQISVWTEMPLTDGYRDSVEQNYHIACNDEQPVATGFIDLQSGEIGAIFVLPAFMEQGIGRRVLAHLEQLALAAGLVDIHLDATPNAAAFYRRCGYEGQAQAIYFSPTGLELQCVPMRKRLLMEVAASSTTPGA
ncbi:GNAT family N-acetyltransferase [Pseudomonas sp. PA27(2017)]|uniref:GNAT family N-acetyltransferase n=1 Tax=Pseudomonas sp. PA27(2017) TaxID=1932112 RepID=UPI000961D606|nr:GNAT family N-acetyltransferase [Pseudomonas sp. PA27(2017)]OLU35469.1 GNAT family N-acetyltransferase [Pseudomonas sp. PA27(2017)]